MSVLLEFRGGATELGRYLLAPVPREPLPFHTATDPLPARHAWQSTTALRNIFAFGSGLLGNRFAVSNRGGDLRALKCRRHGDKEIHQFSRIIHSKLSTGRSEWANTNSNSSEGIHRGESLFIIGRVTRIQ